MNIFFEPGTFLSYVNTKKHITIEKQKPCFNAPYPPLAGEGGGYSQSTHLYIV